MLKLGSKIRIKENAYGDSTELRDKQARGKAGEIIADLTEQGEGWEGCWVVKLDNLEGEFYVITDEIEEIKN